MASSGVSGLLQRLVQSVLPPADQDTTTAGEQKRADQAAYLQALALRLAQGGPRWRMQTDEQQIVKQSQRDIAHRLLHVDRDSGVSRAVQFESLHRRWRHLISMGESAGAAPLVRRRAELLYLLQQLQGAGEQRGGVTAFAASLDLAAHTANTTHARETRRNEDAPSSEQQLTAYNRANSALAPAAAQSASVVPVESVPSRALSAPTSDLSEAALLRDILYILLGSDGNYVKYNASSDAFLLLPGVRVDRPQRLLVQRVCELGWLYRKVQTYVTDIMEGGAVVPALNSDARRRGGAATPILTPSDHSGKIEQSFAATLREELNEYIRFITLLETQVDKELRSVALVPANALAVPGAPQAAASAHRSSQFTLKRLLVFVQDAMQTLSLLAMLTDAARGVKGGCLASVIGTHLRHGDPFVVALMKRIMAKTCVPLFELIDGWVCNGTLNDPYSEFFIVSHGGVPSERHWFEKYSLRRGMIPSFFTDALVHKILGIGKAVNFIRHNCKDTKYTLEFKGEYKQMFANGTDLSGFSASIDSAFDRVNAHLLSLLTHRYHFLSHALALKKYMLLSAGDFSAHLIELVARDLDKPARDLSTAHLLGVLEAAKRGSTARDEPDQVLDRISLRRLAPKADELGWDLFALAYHLDDSPLRVVFTDRNLAKYLQLFEFLWQLKRVESRLSAAWAVQTKIGHASALRALGAALDTRGPNVLEPFLRNVAGLRHEMSHFVSNLHSYMMFEVLECAWDEFVNKIRMGPNARLDNASATNGHASKATTTPNTPRGVVSFANFNTTVTSPSQTGPVKEQPKPLDLDGLIHAHKIFLQQIVDKALMGGESGPLLPQLLALFKHVLSFASFNDRLYACLHAEVDRRAEAARAAARSEAAGRWNRSAATGAGDGTFLRELAGYVSEFRALNHQFHSAFIGFLRILRETNRAATLAAKLGSRRGEADDAEEEAQAAVPAGDFADDADEPERRFDPITGVSSVSVRARRAALHLHSLDFLRFRLDFNEFYLVSKSAHQRMLAAYEEQLSAATAKGAREGAKKAMGATNAAAAARPTTDTAYASR